MKTFMTFEKILIRLREPDMKDFLSSRPQRYGRPVLSEEDFEFVAELLETETPS